MRKIPFAGVELTSQRVRGLRGTSELPGRPATVKSNFAILCTNDLVVLHPLGIFSLFFSFLVRKVPFAGIELTSQRVRGLRGTSELPGDRLEGLCVCFLPIHSGLQWTYQPGSHRKKVTQNFPSTFFLRLLLLLLIHTFSVLSLQLKKLR